MFTFSHLPTAANLRPCRKVGFQCAIISLLFAIHICIVFSISVIIHPLFHLVSIFFHIFLYGKSFQTNLCVIYSY